MIPAVEAYRQGKASVCELLDETLSAIVRAEPVLNSFITIADRDTLQQQATELQRELETRGPRGPLHGIPVGVKDVIHTENLRTTGGSKALEDFIPSQDAESVRRLRDAGALIIGKNNTHEFAFGVTTDNEHFGACTNPFDPDRIPGGSSGGSAAVVGAQLVIGSLATDTGSSIRRPAAFCGAVGVKPRFGRISRRGVMLLSWSLDHVGPIAATVSDAVAMIDALAGHDPEDEASLDEIWQPLLPFLKAPHGITSAGVPRGWIERYCDPGIAHLFAERCRHLEAEGCRLVDIDPPHTEDLLPALRLIALVEANLTHEQRYAAHGSGYSDELKTLVEAGAYIPARDYLKAQQLRTILRRWSARTFAEVDVIVSPTMTTIAPLRQDRNAGAPSPSVITDAAGIFCSLGALGGLPSYSIPMSMYDGMPTALLLTGPSRAERAMLRLAEKLELRGV